MLFGGMGAFVYDIYLLQLYIMSVIFFLVFDENGKSGHLFLGTP